MNQGSCFQEYTNSRVFYLRIVFSRQPDANSEAWRAACLAQLGRDEEAKIAADNAIDMGGEFIQGEDWLQIWAFKNQRDLEHFVDGLNKSGVLKDKKRDPDISATHEDLSGQ